MYSTYGNKDTITDNIIKDAKYFWYQSHDVDANMAHGQMAGSSQDTTPSTFTPIGSLYDKKGSEAVANAQAYMSYLNGNYNGNTYTIKNVEINSKGTAVGLFGGIIGANVRNLVLYSDKGNYIQRAADSPKTWYVMGGLCGFAAIGQENAAGTVAIENCTVSGYTIQDNSTSSAWGDACIGGMFGMSTMDLRNCTAVNDIVLNTNYTDQKNLIKSDGVSVRTGGLVGSMRGNISYCYTGGEISCTNTCLDNATKSYGSKLFLGGITGGICMKSGNFLALMGKSVKGVTGWSDDTTYSYREWGSKKTDNGKKCEVPTTYIYNCYTYIKMPSSKEQISVIKSIEPLGSNGETPFENASNYHVKVLVENSYYYKNNIPQTKTFAIKDHGRDGYEKIVETAYGEQQRDWTNIESDAIALEWSQLAGLKPITKNNQEVYLTEVLNRDPAGGTGGSSFGAVTTILNNQSVDGKYSFPGTRTDLEGENYPFPTILKQGEINVHYGEWPREGIYWDESRASMDIFEDLQLEGDNKDFAVKTFKLLDPKPVLAYNLSKENFTITYSNGEKEEEAAVLSDNVADSQFTASPVGNEAILEAFSSEMTEEGEDGFASGVEVYEVTGAGETDAVQAEEPGTRTLSEEERIAEIMEIRYDDTEKCYLATVKALKTGATIITVSTTGIDNQSYRASFNLNVSADLSVFATPESVTQKIGQSQKIILHAVPTAQLSSAQAEATIESVADSTSQVQASDGWTAGETMEAEPTDLSEEIAGFAGSEIIAGAETLNGDIENIAAAEEFETSSFGADAAAVEGISAAVKDIASKMQWKIDASVDGAVTTTQVVNGSFTVTSYAEGTVALTITGTYIYNNIAYTAVIWLDVITTGDAANADIETTVQEPSVPQTPSDTSLEEGGFADDIHSSDQNSDTGDAVDMVPEQNETDFSAEESGWQSE